MWLDGLSESRVPAGLAVRGAGSAPWEASRRPPGPARCLVSLSPSAGFTEILAGGRNVTGEGKAVDNFIFKSNRE